VAMHCCKIQNNLGFTHGPPTKQRRKELLVTPEDIQELKDLNAFVSIGHHNITLTKFRYKKLPIIADSFVQRPELDLTSMIISQESLIKNVEPVTSEKEGLDKSENKEIKVVVEMESQSQKQRTSNNTGNNKEPLVKNTKPDIVRVLIEDDSKRKIEGNKSGDGVF